MEELLQGLIKDAQAAKFQPIRQAAQNALDVLNNKEEIERLPAHMLRERCLEPLHLALESKTKRLMTCAVSGIEKLLKDERFQSSIEVESEDKWLPIQVLKTVYSTPNLPEDIQTNIMKLLLKMTFSTAWCMNSRIITQVAQVYIDTYSSSSSTSLKGIVQAALTQLLGGFAEKLHGAVNNGGLAEEDVMSDFNAKGDSKLESLTEDVVTLLNFLTERVAFAAKAGQNKQAVPLLLEGILAVMSNSPVQLRHCEAFQHLVWQNLCPTLISLLGIPKADNKPKSSGDAPRNMDTTNLAAGTAKIIYSISVEIARLVGPVRSLRPVLESLFHRILLCTSTCNRHDAIKTLRELLTDPSKLCDITVTYCDEKFSSKSTTKPDDLALVKLIVDAVEDCSQSSDSALCYTAVMCVADLLTSIEKLDRGIGVHSDSVKVIHDRFQQKSGTQRSNLERSNSATSRNGKVNHEPKTVADVKHEHGTVEGINSTEENVHSRVEGINSTGEGINSTVEDLHDVNNSDIQIDHHHDQSIARQAEEQASSDKNGTEVVKMEGNGSLSQTEQKTGSVSQTEQKNGSVTQTEQKNKSVLQTEQRNGSLSHYKAVEKQSAVGFIQEMITYIPHILTLSTVTEVDEALQKFASNFSEKDTRIDKSNYSKAPSTVTVLNADSIYSTSYAALCLNLQLFECGYYDNKDTTLIPVSERKFIDSVLDTDMFLYLSPDWLSTVYKAVLQQNLLEEGGLSLDIDDHALVTVLKDVGGKRFGARMMRDSVLTEVEEVVPQVNKPEVVKAGKLLAGQILSTCWDSILDVLSVLLNGKSAIGVTNTFAIMIGTEGAKEESLRKREALCKCLDGLQTAAKLCCSLGLQERCEGVFTLLANTSCVMDDFKHAALSPVDKSGQKPSILPQPKPKLVKLHAAHVLSMDAMMSTGLEIGSHSANCWKQVFRCCAFISELEHTYFSSGNNQSSLPRIQQEHAVDVATDEQSDELYNVPMTPVVPVAPRINVPALIKQSSIESGWDRSITGEGMLNYIQASQALCGLSQQVDRLFEEAANNLNMTALTEFLGSLCDASKYQLHRMSKTMLEEEDLPGEHQNLPVNSLHLYRLQNVLMKVAHSDRPLIHLIKAWSVVSSYLVECAGHKDRSISKMAVTCVHDFIIAMMTSRPELQHFHTNEMLCKTFENILCLELCDGDVQDQIVCSICELVEASASEIKSGWRPLFGALRAVRIEYTTVEEVNEARQRHVEAVLDVFDVYLSTDNILVFANATVDCILCLLKYVRGPGEFEDSDTDDSDSLSDYMTSSPDSENLVIPALQYLKQCSVILQSMWKMPACPIFHGAKRIQVDTTHRCVDRDIPNMNFQKFAKYFKGYTDTGEDNSDLSSSPCHDTLEKPAHGDTSSLLSNDSGILLTTNKDENKIDGAVVSLEQLDNHTGILHVWFLMLEGLSGAVCACPRTYQPHTMETMFELLRSASHVPGPQFVVYSVNHLLFPMLQSWLRSGNKKFGYWETGATNFKQCCGHTADLVVDLLHDFKEDSSVCPLIEEVLRQLLTLLTECVAQPFEVISRLGCSCIRHVLLSAHSDFTEAMWQIVIDGLETALDVTTYCLRQLMLLFKTNSENFYGDIGQVKVATRKDCSVMDFVRIWHLAQQVFLLDSQVSIDVPQVDDSEDKSYVFLLYPPGYENSLNPDHILARVPFRSIVVGLLSHQLLLQTVGCILLEGSHSSNSQMPGMLSQLSTRNVIQLLKCLHNSYKLACKFDLRPGLKFLVQKVAHTPVAVNLYKQAGASMVFYIHTLIKICANIPNINKDIVRALLKLPNKEENGNSSKDKQNSGADNEQGANISNRHEEMDDSSKRNEKSGKEPNVAHSERSDDEIGSEINSEKADEENAIAKQNLSSKEVKQGHDFEGEVNKQTDKSAFSSNTAKISMCSHENLSQRISDNPALFLSLLLEVCDELCQNYLDILYDKEGTSCVDSMADQQLFFLIAQPDDFPDLPHKKKVDVKQLDKELEKTKARLQGQGQTVLTQAVSVQEAENEVVSPVTIPITKSVLPPLSPVHSEAKSKRELRSEHESKVYNLATDKLIKNLMTEYKKHKNQKTMPVFSKGNKKDNSEKKKKKKQLSSDPVERVIEEQQQTSIMKDSEAHLQSWTELLCTILGLFDQLDDDKFTTLLPTVFRCVNQIICHAQDMRLRQGLAQWLHRVGNIYNLGPSAD